MTLTSVLSNPAKRQGPVPGKSPVRRPQISAWVGVAVTTAVAGWLAVVGEQTLAAQHQVGLVIGQMAGDLVGPAMVVFVVIVMVCERLWPAVPRPLLSRAHVVDALYVVIAAAIVVPALPLVQMGLNVELRTYAPFLVLGRLPAVPQLLVSALILIGIDAMNWLAHVSNHRVLAFWRLHALHHSQEDMSVLTTFRTHPLLHVTYIFSLVPALMLSASGTVPDAVLIVYGCLVTLAHANVRWTFGPLGRVIVSPAYHRLHHSRYAGGRGHVNFGFALVCWDQLAHRAVFPDPAAPPVATGLVGRPVPVEQAGQQTTTRTVVDQLVQPFRLISATDNPPGA